MFDTTNRLFDNVDQIMRGRRIAAINGCARLAWLVRVDTYGADEVTLLFDSHPSWERIAERAREKGLLGEICIHEITAKQVKPRPLLLNPWNRVRK